MKKLLTLLLLVTLGLTSKAQTQNDTMRVFMYNPYQYGCEISILFRYQSSTQSDTVIGGKGNLSSHIIFPNSSTQDVTRFTEAWIVFPHDTTMFVKFMQAGISNLCYGYNQHYCVVSLFDTSLLFYQNHTRFYKICSDTVAITGLNELKSPTKNVVRILDEMGRDTKPVPNKTLIYLYSDGTIERKVIVK